MEYYLILASSVTFAQRMQKALDRAGIRSGISHAPRDLTDAGCAYVVRVAVGEIHAAMTILYGAGLSPMQLFFHKNGQYHEVRL